MESKTIYYKEGRRYIPYAMGINRDTILTEGIWIVRRNNSCKSITSGNWLQGIYRLDKVGNLDPIDFPQIATMEEYADVVANVITDKKNKNLCISDFARVIVKAMFDYKK